MVQAEGGNRQGYPARSLFSLEFKGLDPYRGDPLFADEKGETNHGVYLQSREIGHLVYEGPVDPIVTGGWSNTFHYKNLSLNVFVTAQGGNKIRLYP